MIAAPPGLVARFKHTGTGPKGEYSYHTEEPVVAFDDEGSPLIVGPRRARRLIPASAAGNYDGLGHAMEQDYIALIPGGGWRLKYDVKGENGETWKVDCPLVAWALTRTGEVVPLEADADGLVSQPEQVSNTTPPIIYYPGSDCD